MFNILLWPSVVLDGELGWRIQSRSGLGFPPAFWLLHITNRCRALQTPAGCDGDKPPQTDGKRLGPIASERGASCLMFPHFSPPPQQFCDGDVVFIIKFNVFLNAIVFKTVAS